MITRQDVETWECVTKKTPAGGTCYYSATLDICVTIYHGYLKVFSKRTNTMENKPWCFELSNYVTYEGQPFHK